MHQGNRRPQQERQNSCIRWRSGGLCSSCVACKLHLAEPTCERAWHSLQQPRMFLSRCAQGAVSSCLALDRGSTLALTPTGQANNLSICTKACLPIALLACLKGLVCLLERCLHCHRVTAVLQCPQPAAQVHNEGGGKRVVVTKNLPGERWLKVVTHFASCAAVQTFTCPDLLVRTILCAPPET